MKIGHKSLLIWYEEFSFQLNTDEKVKITVADRAQKTNTLKR